MDKPRRYAIQGGPDKYFSGVFGSGRAWVDLDAAATYPSMIEAAGDFAVAIRTSSALSLAKWVQSGLRIVEIELVPPAAPSYRVVRVVE